MFRARLRDMPENNLRQADIPDGGAVIPNPLGTAPGRAVPGRRRQGRVRGPGCAVRDAGDDHRGGAPRSPRPERRGVDDPCLPDRGVDRPSRHHRRSRTHRPPRAPRADPPRGPRWPCRTASAATSPAVIAAVVIVVRDDDDVAATQSRPSNDPSTSPRPSHWSWRRTQRRQPVAVLLPLADPDDSGRIGGQQLG